MKLVEDLGTIFNGRKTKRRWGIYECPDCKKHFEVQTSNVKSGKSTKCRTCSAKKCNITHGLVDHPLYHVWTNMKSRCYNEKNKRYNVYGAEGVTVCNEWKSSRGFKNFYDWAIKNGWTTELKLDKDILSEKLGIIPHVYSPETCMFVEQTTNSRATRRISSVNTSGYRGVHQDQGSKKWIAQISVNRKKIRIGRFYTSLEAAYAYDEYVKENNLEHTINFKEK